MQAKRVWTSISLTVAVAISTMLKITWKVKNLFDEQRRSLNYSTGIFVLMSKG